MAIHCDECKGTKAVIQINWDEFLCEGCMQTDWHEDRGCATEECPEWIDTPENRKEALDALSSSWDYRYYTTEVSRNGFKWGDEI